MSKSVAPRYCPRCDGIVYALASPNDPEDGILRCPVCAAPTVKLALNFDFPIGPVLALRIFAALAKILQKTGVIEDLQAKAAKTETPLDDFALRAAAAIIAEAAKL